MREPSRSGPTDSSSRPSQDDADEALAELFVLAASVHFRAGAGPHAAAVERAARVLLELSNGAVAGTRAEDGALTLAEGLADVADSLRKAGRAALARRLDALVLDLGPLTS